MPPKKKVSDPVPVWLLIRDDKDNQHYVIDIEKVQNPTKKKIKIGDSVAFCITGDRNDRMRGPIITMGILFITY